MELRAQGRRKAEINIVPLVDVLFVIILFFLVTMQFRNRNVLNITPPPIETAGENKADDEIIIGVGPEGELYYNNQEVSREEMTASLRIAGELNAEASVLVLADEVTELQNVTFVMDESRKAGLEKIRLQAR